VAENKGLLVTLQTLGNNCFYLLCVKKRVETRGSQPLVQEYHHSPLWEGC